MDPKLNILLVDDEGEEAAMFAYALDTLEAPVEMHHEWSVDEACNYLKRRSSEELPDTIVVDSFLRGESGRRLLDCVECIPNLVSVPIVVLSGAELPEAGSEHPRINRQYVKPVTIAELRGIVREIIEMAERYATERQTQNA